MKILQEFQKKIVERNRENRKYYILNNLFIILMLFTKCVCFKLLKEIPEKTYLSSKCWGVVC